MGYGRMLWQECVATPTSLITYVSRDAFAWTCDYAPHQLRSQLRQACGCSLHCEKCAVL